MPSSMPRWPGWQNRCGRLGVGPGDRVAGYMPNLIETAIAMLATTSIGAVWSSCATDIGPLAALDRLGQIEPKVLFYGRRLLLQRKGLQLPGKCGRGCQGHSLPEEGGHRLLCGRETGSSRRSPTPSIMKTFCPRRRACPRIRAVALRPSRLHHVFLGHDRQAQVHGAGRGRILINHLKELILHTDLKREDRIFYITTCSWMMWNWLLSSLGVGGNDRPLRRQPELSRSRGHVEDGRGGEDHHFRPQRELYQLPQEAKGFGPGKIMIFPPSARFRRPARPLSPRASNMSTGRSRRTSISIPFRRHGHQRLFCHRQPHPARLCRRTAEPGPGHEDQGLRREGETRSWTSRESWSARRRRPPCPSISGTIPTEKSIKSAYFEHLSEGVWRHGDYIVIHSDTGGVTFYGRSDAVLKPSGVRIGTAEIYNVVEKIEGDRRQPGDRPELGGRSARHPLCKTEPGGSVDRRAEGQDQEDPAGEGLAPPCPCHHPGDAEQSLYSEHEEGGERGDEHHPWQAGPEQGCFEQPGGPRLFREDRPGAAEIREGSED